LWVLYNELALISVERLGKRYGHRWIFRNIGFVLSRGERLVIRGRNGSGKSTLLSVIAGLTPRSEGVIRLPDADTRNSLGFSALEQTLYPQLSPAEHLMLGGRLRGVPSRSEELLEFVGLTSARDMPTFQISTGMKARLKLAIAIQARPCLLLLDEPTAGMDDEGRELVQRIADEQSDRGCLILATNEIADRRIATHELELAG
jgi:ABC-type multidrug transport system ATPase subunit